MARFTIYDLAATIDARAASERGVLYRKLLDKGPEHCAKKFGEEAVETVIAASRIIATTSSRKRRSAVSPAGALKSRGVKLRMSRRRWRSARQCPDLKRRPRESGTNKGSFMDIRAPEQQYNPIGSSRASSGRDCVTTPR